MSSVPSLSGFSSTESGTGGRTEIRRVYTGIEHGIIEVPFEDLVVSGKLKIYPEVQGKNYFRLYSKTDKIVFQAGSHVGLIPINENLSIEVTPRFPIKSIDRLLKLSSFSPVAIPSLNRFYEGGDEDDHSYIDCITTAFINSLEEIKQNGRLKQYNYYKENTSFPKGKLHLTDTIRTNFSRGTYSKIVSGWFSRDVDIGLNRCLKYTLWHLYQRYRGIRNRAGVSKILFELNSAFKLFEDVELDPSKRFSRDQLFLDTDKIPSNRFYYNLPINLAKLILANKGVTFDGEIDEILMASLIIDMERIFEKYIRNVLSQALQDFGEYKVIDGNRFDEDGGRKHFFDENSGTCSEIYATPDIILKDARGYSIIVDTKYRPVENNPPREDLNQIAGYLASYQARIGLLIYPKHLKSKCGLEKLGNIGEQKYYSYYIDLDSSNILIEEKKLAESIHSLTSP